jgi:uncharacterized membrane protein YeiH
VFAVTPKGKARVYDPRRVVAGTLTPPLYAIVAPQSGVKVSLPVLGVLVLAVIGPTAGGVRGRVLRRAAQAVRAGEWFVSIAALTGIIWVLCDSAGLPIWVSALIAFAVGHTVRVLALYFAWEEPLAKEPKGVYRHNDGRPLLGRQLKGKSAREMAYLGLTVDDAAGTDGK